MLHVKIIIKQRAALQLKKKPNEDCKLIKKRFCCKN